MACGIPAGNELGKRCIARHEKIILSYIIFTKETVTMDGGRNRISMTSNKGIMYSGVDFTILLTESKFNSTSDFVFSDRENSCLV